MRVGSSGGTWEDRRRDHHFLRAGGPEARDPHVRSPCEVGSLIPIPQARRGGSETEKTHPGSHSWYTQSRNGNQLA